MIVFMRHDKFLEHDVYCNSTSLSTAWTSEAQRHISKRFHNPIVSHFCLTDPRIQPISPWTGKKGANLWISKEQRAAPSCIELDILHFLFISFFFFLLRYDVSLKKPGGRLTNHFLSAHLIMYAFSIQSDNLLFALFSVVLSEASNTTWWNPQTSCCFRFTPVAQHFQTKLVVQTKKHAELGCKANVAD